MPAARTARRKDWARATLDSAPHGRRRRAAPPARPFRLWSALARFSAEARLDTLAGHEVPDARKRLTHVVNLTDQAAHRTLDLVEKSGPLVEEAARGSAQLLEQWDAYPNRSDAGASVGTYLAMAAPDTFNTYPDAVKDYARIQNALAKSLLGPMDYVKQAAGSVIRGAADVAAQLPKAIGTAAVAPYETTGTKAFAETVRPFVKDHNTILLTNHGIVCWADTVMHAEWLVEIFETCCKTYMLAQQIGKPLSFISESKLQEILALKLRLGFPDSRLHDAAIPAVGTNAELERLVKQVTARLEGRE